MSDDSADVRPRSVIRGWNVQSEGLTGRSGEPVACMGVPAMGGAERRPGAALRAVSEDDALATHEAQTSDLAARPGALMLDYLRARLPDDDDTRAALRGWVGQWQVRGIGWRGWYDESGTVLDGGIVAWCSDRARAETEGLLVDLPGRACACLGERLVPFLAWCCAVGHVTRADYAIDDRSGRLTFERVLCAVRSGAVVTRWQQARPVELYDLRTGERVGWTLYLGSRRSECLVRIYDKAAEQGRGGGPWVRLELESKGAFADALAREYFAEGSAAVVGQLARRVRFAVRVEGDSNRRRWPTAPWWAEVLGSVKPGPSLLCGEKQVVTVDALRAYVERQAGPSLATVLMADRGDMSWTEAMLERCQWRMRPKHRAALALAEATAS